MNTQETMANQNRMSVFFNKHLQGTSQESEPSIACELKLLYNCREALLFERS